MKIYLLRWLCLCGFIVWFGCYSPQRDLSVDPYNSPVINLLNASYQPSDRAVVVQWEYLGKKPVASFVLERRGESLFRNLERAPGTDGGAQFVVDGCWK